MSKVITEEKTFESYLKIAKRRRLELLLPAALLLSMSFVIALLLPPSYKSQATLLIEGQDVPTDFVRSMITSYAAQQVKTIRQRVMTKDTVSALIEKYKLYGTKEGGSTMADVQKFNNSFELELINADVLDPRNGRPREATIAFVLSFTYTDAETVKQVTDDLVAMFLVEDLRTRTAQASGTADFLGGQAEKLSSELASLERQLADFKIDNQGSLPEEYEFTLKAIERTEGELSQLRSRYQDLQNRRVELLARVSQISPSAPVVLPTGELVMSNQDRLRALQTEYRQKVSIYNENHPDVMRLDREIKNLKAELGITEVSVDELKRQLAEQQQKLSDLRSKYSESHNEIQVTQRVIAGLQTEIRNKQSASNSSPANSAVADNPTYVYLKGSLDSTENEINSVSKRVAELEQRLEGYEESLRDAPLVEQEYRALVRKIDTASAKYKDIEAKQREAAVAISLEQEQKGGRFVVIEPPLVPMQPDSPNRPAIVFLGIVLALGAGLVCASIVESMDGTIHGAAQLANCTGGVPPLVSIPYIYNTADKVNRAKILMYSGILIALACAACVLYIEFLYQP